MRRVVSPAASCPVRRVSVYTPGTRAIRADAFDYRAIHVECRLCRERSVINLPHNLQAIGGAQKPPAPRR
jgi:hypothetical protein